MKIDTSKNAELPQPPISRKAYLDIIARIYQVLGEGHRDAALMLEEMDFYLKHRYYSGRLMPNLEIAFLFLKQDIDIAIERARMARERARIRREGEECDRKVEPQIMPWRKRTPGRFTFDGDNLVIDGKRSWLAPFTMDFVLRDVKERYQKLRERLSQPEEKVSLGIW